MRRRQFLGAVASGAAIAASAFPKPATAQGEPRLTWTCASSFPDSLEIVHGGIADIARRVADATDGAFQILGFGKGGLVADGQILEAVRSGTIECALTQGDHHTGTDPALAFDSGLSYSLNARQHAAWLLHGGGRELLADIFRDHGIVALPAGNSGVPMGGWFRREIHGIADLDGLRLRIDGSSARILARLGIATAQTPPDDIMGALERAELDGTTWSGPHDDEQRGYYRHAPYYYYPGWGQGGGLSLYVGAPAWERLPPAFQAALASATAAAGAAITARHDALNPSALRRLVLAGSILRPLPREVLDACYKEAQAFHDELAASDARFRRVHAEWKKFRDDVQLWWRVAEVTFDNHVLGQAARR